MNKNIEIHIIRVFVNPEGKFGNPVGIILDEGQEINLQERQKIATKLGFSESVFINDKKVGRVSIHNPQKEIKFAGHAMLGTAWYLNKINKKRINSLECKGGNVITWESNNLTWIRAPLSIMPPWNYEQFESAKLVEQLAIKDTESKKHTVVWAWLDQSKNIIRARTFAPDWGIPEDQANGSGSMLLSSRLGREIQIIHGLGSIIFAKPSTEGFADIGGMVLEDTPKKIASSLRSSQ